MKLYVWRWAEGHSWEQIIVMAHTEYGARVKAQVKDCFMHKEVLNGPATEVYEETSAVIYDVY